MMPSIVGVGMVALAIVVTLLLIRRGRACGLWIFHTLYRLNVLLERHVCRILDDIERPMRRRGDGIVEIIAVRSRRYLAALGGYFITLIVFGVATSPLVGTFGAMLLTVFPGALVGAWVYRWILHQ